MVVVKVWCLPANQTEKTLRQLHKVLVAEFIRIPDLGLTGKRDVTCLFPTDQMKYGLGEEIIISYLGMKTQTLRYQGEKKIKRDLNVFHIVQSIQKLKVAVSILLKENRMKGIMKQIVKFYL